MCDKYYKDQYMKQIENVIKQIIKPLKGVPFNLVVEALSWHKVIPFDNEAHNDILKLLEKVGEIAGSEIKKKGIKRSRSNEVGNDVEKFVKSAFKKIKELEEYKDVNISVDVPSTLSWNKKATGYPDIIFFYKEQPYYLECKTYNKKGSRVLEIDKNMSNIRLWLGKIHIKNEQN